MLYKNMTPHELVIYNTKKEKVLTVPPSGEVARVGTKRKLYNVVNGIEFWDMFYTDKPEFETKEDTIYIVSGAVKALYPNRLDVVSPGELLRDEKGKPYGCVGLNALVG